MHFHSISQELLSQQAKYNSFIMCQTKNIPLSEKLPFIVTTMKGKIIKPSPNEDSYEEFQCNYSFDCVQYIINGKHVILGQGAWIKPLLTTKQKNLLQSYEIINFEPLELKNELKFYFYHEKRKVFIQIVPKYLILPDCIVFEDVSHLTQTAFKIINLTETEGLAKMLENDKQRFVKQTYTFESQYAIMSDIHFLGSFVRGFKPIGSYVKKRSSTQYFHLMDQALLRNLKRLYPFSSL